MTPAARPSDRLRLDAGPVDGAFWPHCAAHVAQWLDQRGLPARDALVLLPFAGLLAPAREAFARHGGWLPRIETSRTWSAALAPPSPAAPGQISLDTVTDRASAAALLRGQSIGAEWAQRDRRGFDAAVLAFVDTAQALLRAAHEREPAARQAWWSAWRESLAGANAGPGAAERWLARIAVEWAAAADAPPHDRLWAERPAAWIVLSVAGTDALAEALLAAAERRGDAVLRLLADPPAEAPFDGAAALAPPRRWLGEGLEAEAHAATLAVLEAVERGQAPVALIAQDRVVVRRIRALLERSGLPLRDETGWTLSTTRSAARLMALLRAAAPAAGRDDLLDALKVEHAGSPALKRMEAGWRRDGAAGGGDMAWCDDAFAPLRAWAAQGSRSLAAWLAGLRPAAPGVLRSLADDDAGRAVLAALRLDDTPASPALQAAMAATRVDLAGFTDWVDAALEAATFVPAAADAAAVVVTPLARALLRPFGAVVMPGCDHRRLGAATAPPGLLPDALLRPMGLADAAERRERERLAFAQLLRAPRLTLLRRHSEQGEPLAPSMLVEHAWQARRRLGQPAPDELAAPLPQRAIDAACAPRPAPQAAAALPQRLSASAVEQLRACPYRFFAQTLLGLRESAELDAELEKRDYGTWLHGVLHRFHESRVRDGRTGAGRAADRERLATAAVEEQQALGLDAARLLPFRAAFEPLSSHYLDWLDERERQGWRYEAGELEARRVDPALGGVALEGRIDRVDRHAASGARQLIDYKTGNAQALRDKVADPLEDTQLAFYAALLAGESPPGQPPPAMRAIYLALDERKPPLPIEHADVAASAQHLVAGLAQDLALIRAGAGLPALGEGAVCDHCEARGLCRRDHWPATG